VELVDRISDIMGGTSDIMGGTTFLPMYKIPPVHVDGMKVVALSIVRGDMSRWETEEPGVAPCHWQVNPHACE
jgi:hypothetical protein